MASTDLSALHDGIRSAFLDAYPDAHVGRYERLDEKPPKYPCIHFALGEIEPNEPDTDGADATEAILHFAAYVTVKYRTPDAKLVVRQMAFHLLRAIRGRRFGVLVGPARIIRAAPDEWNPAESGYETYRIDWTHEARLDPISTDPVPALPSEVYISAAPEVGAANEPRYTRIA